MNKNLSSGTTKFSKITGNISIANNAFSIPSLYMQGNGVKINASGEGDLANWTANLLFNVKYDEPQYLPGYSFELKGPMNAPALAVNVNSLLDMYKGRQEKILEQADYLLLIENDGYKMGTKEEIYSILKPEPVCKKLGGQNE